MDNDPAVNPNHYEHHQFGPMMPPPSSSSAPPPPPSSASASPSPSSSSSAPPPPQPPQPLLTTDLDGLQYTDMMNAEDLLVLNHRTKQRELANFDATRLSVDTVELYHMTHNLRAEYFLQNTNDNYKKHFLKQISNCILEANAALDCLKKKLINIKKSQRIKNRIMSNSRNAAVNRQRPTNNDPGSESESESEYESIIPSNILVAPADPPIDQQAEYCPHEINKRWPFCYTCSMIHYEWTP